MLSAEDQGHAFFFFSFFFPYHSLHWECTDADTVLEAIKCAVSPAWKGEYILTHWIIGDGLIIFNLITRNPCIVNVAINLTLKSKYVNRMQSTIIRKLNCLL